MKKIRKLGILTGGGDCPGLNAVIRAVVHTAQRQFGLKVCGIMDGYSGLIQHNVCTLELADVSGILPRGGTILGTSNRDNPFRWAESPHAAADEYRDVSSLALKTIEENEIDVLLTVGGDGTQSIAQKFSEKYQLPVIGIPKTIDNDLNGTDVTFGFDTALNTATTAIDKLHSTAEAHHRVMVIEVMGRYAGWIALHAGMAGGGDVILIPEIPFAMEKVCAKILDRQKRGKRFSLVVVAEGAKAVGGQVVVARQVPDGSDSVRLGGIAALVGNQIEDQTGIESRFTILGHVQRGGSPTPFDRILATRFGYHAVEAALKHRFGTMVGLRGSEIKTTSLREAIAVPRRVDPGSDLVRTAMAVSTSFGN
ncbi:MAG: ATP-dependent 6-phosphofructokinase [Candidatus Aminicenantes bacterium]|nr:ATP-dependent 6-phosphofructokinase [Candidatus Aminicenantes bacterium]